MSKIDDLISPKKEVTFKGEKFMIDAGFTLEESPILTRAFGNGDEKVKSEAFRELLKIILKRLYPEATEKEISKVDLKHSADVLDVFYQLDETDKEEQERIKNLLKKRGVN